MARQGDDLQLTHYDESLLRKQDRALADGHIVSSHAEPTAPVFPPYVLPGRQDEHSRGGSSALPLSVFRFSRAIYSVAFPPGGVPRSALEVSGSRVLPAGAEAFGRPRSGVPGLGA